MIKKFLIVYTLAFLLISAPAAAQEWQTARKMHMPRGGATAVKWGHYIYVFGGKAMNNKVLKSVERYDILTDTWDKKTVPDFDKPRYNAAAIVYDDKIYLIGGRDESSALKEVEVYDPVQNAWGEAHNLHEEREGLAAHVLNGLLHVIGGREEYHSIVSDIEWYSAAEDKWKVSSWEMENPRADFFSAVYRDTFYQFGGFYYGLTKTAYRAVPTDDGYSWENLGEMSAGRAYGLSLTYNDKIYLIGGEVADGKSDLVELYDPATGQFDVINSLLSPRSGLTGAVSGDTIFVIGGFEGNNDTPVSTVEFNVPDSTPIGIAEHPPLPRSRILVRGYPNPFNGVITIRLQLPRYDLYRLEIYDVNGRLVKNVFDGQLAGGERRFNWDAKDNNLQTVASGVYFLIVHSAKEIQKLKIAYVR